jgi:hypothetical protein
MSGGNGSETKKCWRGSCPGAPNDDAWYKKFVGRSLNRRLHALRFALYVNIGLTAIGVGLLWQAIAGWSRALP